ncbi:MULTISPECIES: S1C family serine protease [Mammaliicoccus]|uniref:Serine protease HtrA-like n=1 Tax=Mammaliicoccus lentus TaxID=42858 RepID=A0ABS6GX95_MAMLE|nr:S1C family serine protease [Mammaliicoccus lentus]MBF0841761.1 serine protease [Mammaliicoccus lentus]MBU6112971.1 S1C family serine protease [Mammaliicoccus lentus]
MSQKKHVIPRNEYKRQRREFFHNSEREERIRQERKEDELRRAHEKEQQKKNEQRVKENMQKARIEKLTKEEIKKQKEESKDHPTLDLDDERLESSHEDKFSKEGSSIEDDAPSTENNEDSFENLKDNQNIDDSEEIKYKKVHNQSNKLNNKQENEFEINKQLGAEHDEKVEKKSQNDKNILNIILSKIEKHWPIIAIVLAIILIFILVWSIFQNVNPPNESRKSIEEKQSQKGFQKPITNVMEAVEKSKNSVVGVSHEDSDISSKTESSQKEKEENSGVGSGVIYKVENNKTYIVTNSHVISNDKSPVISGENGKRYKGTVVGSDQWSDIAVVTIPTDKDANFKPIKFEDSDNLILGESAIVIGSPLGAEFQNSISTGVVSGLDRTVPIDFNGDDEYDWEIKAIQTDAAVNPGNSGGPILDAQGNLIGVVSLKIDMPNVEGMAFAIPSNESAEYIKKLEKDGKIKRPEMGIMAQNYKTLKSDEQSQITLPSKYNSGMVVTGIDEKGNAQKADVKFLDVIVEMDGKKIENNLEFRKELYNNHKSGEEIKLKLIREGKEITKTLTLK